MLKKQKTMKMSKRINYPVENPKIYLKNIEDKVGADLAKRVVKQANSFVKEIKKHFKEDKYSLDLGIYQSELVGSVFGDIDWYFASRLLNAGFKIESTRIEKHSELHIRK